MRFTWQSLVLGLVAALFSGNCAYAAKPKPVEAAPPSMTVNEARQTLVESLNNCAVRKFDGKYRFSHSKVTFGVKASGISGQCRLFFPEMNNLSVEYYGNLFWRVRANGEVVYAGVFQNSAKDPVDLLWAKKEKRYATMFVDAMLVLRAAALAPDTEEEAKYADFATAAKNWTATAPKPEMPDEARTFKLVAEDAFKRKDFPAALDAYGKALETFPMWPEGHYNAALLAAETEDYDLAAQHMRRYLVLAPDAKDATSAKDKLLLWQHKAKE